MSQCNTSLRYLKILVCKFTQERLRWWCNCFCFWGIFYYFLCVSNHFWGTFFRLATVKFFQNTIGFPEKSFSYFQDFLKLRIDKSNTWKFSSKLIRVLLHWINSFFINFPTTAKIIFDQKSFEFQSVSHVKAAEIISAM